MSELLSEKFNYFVHEDIESGTEDIISETNSLVANGDIDIQVMLDSEVGKKYFYECMRLAENVIKSFEDEKPPINENQQVVLDWLKAYGDKDIGDKPFQTVSYMIDCRRTMSLDYDVSISLRKLDRKQQAQVLQVFSAWVIEQEGE